MPRKPRQIRDVQVNIRIPEDLKAEAEEAAKADHRSLTSLILKLLSDHVKNVRSGSKSED